MADEQVAGESPMLLAQVVQTASNSRVSAPRVGHLTCLGSGTMAHPTPRWQAKCEVCAHSSTCENTDWGRNKQLAGL